MTEIHLYKPNVIDIKVPFPTQWDEITLPELENIAGLLLSENPNALPTIFIQLLKSRLKHTKQANRIIQNLDPEQLYLEALPLLEFIQKKNTLTHFPYKQLVKLPIPQHHFNSITVAMYEDAAIYSHKWQKTNQTAHLIRLITALLNPYKFLPQSNFSLEGLYNRYKAWRTNKKIKKLTTTQIQVIFLWYLGCENSLPTLFPRLYAGSKTSQESTSATFTKIVHQAATSGNYNRADIRALLIKELLFDIECALETQDKKEQEAKNNA